MRRHAAGFTWIELILVLGVLAILAGLAIPSIMDTTIRKQVKEGLLLGDIAKPGVQSAWMATGEMPADNAATGIPPREKIVGNLVKDVNVEAGAITVTFGNNAAKGLDGKRVTLRPAVVVDQPKVPIAWLCHDLPVPQGMEVRGKDLTDVPPNYLPVDCRGASAAK